MAVPKSKAENEIQALKLEVPKYFLLKIEFIVSHATSAAGLCGR
jgi:hypothetical protein